MDVSRGGLKSEPSGGDIYGASPLFAEPFPHTRRMLVKPLYELATSLVGMVFGF